MVIPSQMVLNSRVKFIVHAKHSLLVLNLARRQIPTSAQSIGEVASNPRLRFRNKITASHRFLRVFDRDETNGALMKQGDSRKQARRSRPHTGQRRQDSGKTKTAKISPQDVSGTNPTPENSSPRNRDQENQRGIRTKKHRGSEWNWDAQGLLP
jgi:hypothetical protein